MKISKTLFFLILFLYVHGDFVMINQNVKAFGEEQELSEEDLEIIENLDFLENMYLFQEELDFLEDYTDIDQSVSIGE